MECKKSFYRNPGNMKIRVFCSQPCSNIWKSKNLKGENSPSWQGGLSKNREHKKKQQRECWKRINGSQKQKEYRKKIGYKLVPKALIQTVYEENILKYKTLTCSYCLLPIAFGYDCIEHKIPVSRGGINIKSNLCVACKSCNSKKRNKTAEEYNKIINT